MARSVEDRFWSKVLKTETCWLWQGWKEKQGYGRFWLRGRMERAHRVAYELSGKVTTVGLVLDHLCRTPSCVRPDHLEEVTQRTNILRGEGLAAAEAAQTHCSEGHPFSGENLRRGPRNTRGCRECHNAKNREWTRKKLESDPEYFNRRYAAKRAAQTGMPVRHYRRSWQTGDARTTPPSSDAVPDVPPPPSSGAPPRPA